MPPDKSGGYAQLTPNGVKKHTLKILYVLPEKSLAFSEKGNEKGTIKTDKSL